MPVNITKPIVGDNVGVWGPIANQALQDLQDGVNNEESARIAGDALRPTFAQMNQAIADAVAQALKAF